MNTIATSVTVTENLLSKQVRCSSVPCVEEKSALENRTVIAERRWTVMRMPEYIKRESLIKVLRKSHSYHAETSRDSSLLCRDIRLVKEQPAADVVEVVRCRECIFKQKPKQFGDLQCKILDVPMRNDDFCSYGERKEDVNA